MAEVVTCTCCGQPLNDHTKMLKAIENPLIGLLSQRVSIGRGGRLRISEDSIVKLGVEIARALVPYIMEAVVSQPAGQENA